MVSAIMSDETPAPAAQPQPAAPAAEPAAPVKPTAQPRQAAAQQKPDAPIMPEDVLPIVEEEPAASAVESEENEPDTPPPGSDAKANHAWAEAKRQRRELRDKVKALEAEVARMRESPLPEQEEVQQLRAQVSEYEAKLGQYDLAGTRVFQNKFDAPLNALLQKGASLLVRSGRDPEEAKTLMRSLTESAGNGELDIQQVNSMLADQPFPVQGALLSIVTDFADTAKARAEALKTWKDTRAALTVQATRDQEVSLTEHIERDTGIATQQVLKEGNWMFARSKENQAWNEAVDQRLAAVKGIVRTAKTGDIIKWVMEGVTAKPTRDMFQAMRMENKKLKDELARLVQVTPRIGAGGDGRPTVPETPAKPRDPGQMLDEMFPSDPRRGR
jgi:hypothetical protein